MEPDQKTGPTRYQYTGPLELAAYGRRKEPKKIELLLDADRELIELGVGRTAKVYLGIDIPDQIESESTMADPVFVAVKCLRSDPDPDYAQDIRSRFHQEREQTQSRGIPEQTTFVVFESYGWIDLDRLKCEEQNTPVVSPREPILRKVAERRKVQSWTKPDLDHALKDNGEGLQGAFYAMELCQGTLLDFLESGSKWHELSFYTGLEKAKRFIEDEQEANAKSVDEFIIKFLARRPDHWSGYEILNCFKKEPEAERMRTRMTLELAGMIANVIEQLHRDGGAKTPPIAHRDLKPGNVLLTHNFEDKGLEGIKCRLSDSGFLVELSALKSGAASLSLGHWRSNRVPGSQFYRAPEQAIQPIEVRLKRTGPNTGTSTLFEVFSTKIDNVERGDLLHLSDVRFAQDKGLLIPISEVLHPNVEEFQSNPTPSLADNIRNRLQLRVDAQMIYQGTRDITGHVVKATGFHTDGFSFGAILYDLATGGKNPEDFYLYCLQRYQRAWNGQLKHVDIILQELSEWVSKPKKFFQELTQMTHLPSIINEATYADYLRDSRGVALPKEILAIICRCMLRGYEDCYYSPDYKESVDAQPQAGVESPGSTAGGKMGGRQIQGWNTAKNVQAFKRIAKDISSILGNDKFSVIKGIPVGLQKDTFLRLRCLGHGK